MLKDYICTIDYHLGKANVVVDALSRKAQGMMAHMRVTRHVLLHEMRTLGVELCLSETGGLLANFWVKPILLNQIKKMQRFDPRLENLKNEVSFGSRIEFWIRDNGTLMIGSRMCVPDQEDLKQELMPCIQETLKYIVLFESTIGDLV